MYNDAIDSAFKLAGLMCNDCFQVKVEKVDRKVRLTYGFKTATIGGSPGVIGNADSSDSN